MNKKKLIFLAILTALSVIIITNKAPITINKLKSSSSSHQNILSPISITEHTSSQRIQRNFSTSDNAFDKKRTSETIESQVPWQELNEKWLEDLKGFLVLLSDRDGIRMFNEYKKSHEMYLKENDRLGAIYQKIHASEPLDTKKEDEFAVEAAEVFKKHTKLNKKIFGQHFDAVKKFHKEFEESIQVYSRDMPIALDFGFDN